MDVTHRTMNAISKRDEAIRKWHESDTATLKGKKQEKDFKITFVPGAMLLAAVAAGSFDEVKRLVKEGADVNYANIDGLSSLHQACIDENLEMVDLLLSLGANVNIRDNEGWTPLHAASSSGSLDIVLSLLKNKADVSYVNTDGELAVDLADEDEIREILMKEIKKQKVDMEKARTVEHDMMLADIKRWIAEKKIPNVRDVQGATALHVAASKSYTDLIELLVDTLKMDVNIRDFDGWTPLHAAVYWKQRDAINALMARNADPNAKTTAGIPPIDLADTDMISFFKSAIKKAMQQTKNNNNNKTSDSASNSPNAESLPHINMKPNVSALKQVRPKKTVTPAAAAPISLPPKPKPTTLPTAAAATAKATPEVLTEENEKAEVSSYDAVMELKRPPSRPPVKEELKPLPTPKLPAKLPAKPPIKVVTPPQKPPTSVSKPPATPPAMEKPKFPSVTSAGGPKLPPGKLEIKVTDMKTSAAQPKSPSTSATGIKLPPQSKQRSPSPSSASVNKGIKLPPQTKSDKQSPAAAAAAVEQRSQKPLDSDADALREKLSNALTKVRELQDIVSRLTKENEELKNAAKGQNSNNQEMERLILQNKRLENENATLIKAMSVYSRNRTRGV